MTNFVEETNSLSFDINGIKECQRNRHPLLFLDRITEVVPGKFAKGLKNFSYNEWFFPAHFQDDPNVPGFIQVECLTQTFIMTFLSLNKYKGKKTNFLKIKDFHFKKKIIPGDTLHTEAQLISFKRGIARGEVKGFSNGEIACFGELLVSLPDTLSEYKPKINQQKEA